MKSTLPRQAIDHLKPHVTRRKPDHVLTVENGPPLPPGFEKASGKHPFFWKAWKWNVPLTTRRSVEMYPNVFTMDASYLNYLSMMRERGQDLLTVSLDDEGFVGETGIHKPVSAFGTVSGYMADPMAYPLKDNTLLRESLGLPNDWRRERDRQIYREWVDLFFAAWYDRPVKITDKSKFGMPYMEYAKAIKGAIVERALSDQEFPKILKKLEARRLRDLRKDHQVILGGIVGKRGQSDSAETIRMVADREYAMSGGRAGKLIQTDKKVVVDNISYPGCNAQRARPIVGYSTTANSIGQILSTGHLYAAYERFAPCLKFAELQDKIDELCDEFLPLAPVLSCFAADISNFDQTALAEFKWKEITASMATRWDPAIVSLQDLMHRAPYFTPALEVGGEAYWSGNPDNLNDFDSTGMLKSGHNMVTIVGIIEVVGDFLITADYAFGNVLGNVKSILEGDYHLRLWDKGDDHVIWGEPSAVQRYQEFATAKDGDKVKYSYFAIAPEDGKQFIGQLMQRTGPRSFKALPRIHSLHEKSACNEHSVRTVFRPCWALGGFARKELYSASPAYDAYLELNRACWRDSGCEAKFGSLDAILDAGMDEGTTFWRQARTVIDLDVLINPQKLDYRYAEGAVSAGVVDLFKSTIKQELTSFWAHRLYSGEILDPFRSKA